MIPERISITYQFINVYLLLYQFIYDKKGREEFTFEHMTSTESIIQSFFYFDQVYDL